MKRTLATVCVSVVVAALLSACGAPAVQEAPAVTPLPTPVPISAADLLADALKYYEAGDYEEAIIAYLGVIEIEPRSFDAQLGLGKSYRGAGKVEEAVTALLTARELDGENIEAAYELGYAYIDGGQYAEAQTLIAPLWNDGQGDGKSGILLLLSLAGQEKTDEVLALLQDECITNAVQSFTTEPGGEVALHTVQLYLGGYDANGARSGCGVGLYPEGYVYVGEYAGGLRSGQGIWYYPTGSYFTGAWENDAPNGPGELVYDADGNRRIGTWKDGVEHGEMEGWNVSRAPEGHPHLLHWKYLAESGIPIPQYEDPKGYRQFSVCQDCGDVYWGSATVPFGIPTFYDGALSRTIVSDERYEG